MMDKFIFSEFVGDGWCKDSENSKFLLRLYSIVPCPERILSEYFAEFPKTAQIDGLPVWFTGCRFKADGLNKFEFGTTHSHPETGQMVMSAKVSSSELPLGNYLVLTTPFKIDGVDLEEAATLSRLNRMEAMLSIFFGSNTVSQLLFEGVFQAKPDGEYVVRSDEFATPSLCDGPAFTQDNWMFFEETITKIDGISDEAKSARLNRALEFFHKGKNSRSKISDERFFFYWTAIQILCEGKGTMETNRRLQKIYEFSASEVEKKLFWEDIFTARNKFFHDGRSIELSKDSERYLQLLFLDLLRNELELEPLLAARSSIENLEFGFSISAQFADNE